MSDVAALFNTLGGRYLSSMYTSNDWTRYVDKKEKEVIFRILELNAKERVKKEKILDLGMGPGRWSKFFVEQGFSRVYGLDVAPKMVAYARKNIQSKTFKAMVGDMRALPFEENFFDKVFSFRSFKYLYEPKVALGEIARVLNPSGIFLLEISNKSLLNVLLVYLAKFMIRVNPGLPLESRWRYYLRVRFYTKEKIQNLVKDAGFRIITLEPLFILPSIPLPPNKQTVRFWRLLDRILFEILPQKWFVRSWIFLMKKQKNAK